MWPERAMGATCTIDPVVHDPLLDTVVNGRYHVVRMLGEGGMSVVYEVQHVKLKRQFALKRLLPMLAATRKRWCDSSARRSCSRRCITRTSSRSPTGTICRTARRS